MSTFYAGVIICSIRPYYDSNPRGDSGIVRFYEYGNKDSAKKGDTTGVKALFLHRVREIGDISRAGGDKDFEGEKISYEKAKEIIGKESTPDVNLVPLFCVHGFNVEASALFRELHPKIQTFVRGKKYYPVPVVWPCTTNNGNGLPGHNYSLDQTTTSQSAGRLFADLAELVPNSTWEHKSLLMHSMGNHVAFNGACANGKPNAQFDELFMVAADIPFDSFHMEPEDEGGVFANKKVKAKNFMGMLKEGGKIHALHNVHDIALTASTHAMNGINRLGQRGLGKYYSAPSGWYDDKQRQLVGEEVFDGRKYKNVDCQDKNMSDGKGHSYQFEDWAIAYYSNPDGQSTFMNNLHSYKMN